MNWSRSALAVVMLFQSALVLAQVPRTAAVPGARVYILEPRDGATVKGPVKVVMGLSGMGVAPAGADFPETGHHHILVDVDKLPPFDAPIPVDDNHRHFGKGQTEAVLELPPGRHTLQLLLGDRNHIPHNPPVMSQRITITVEK